MKTTSSSCGSARGLHIAIVASEYHAEIVNALRDGAAEQFSEAGGESDDLRIVTAPGAFELIAICKALADRGDLDAIVALGCIITGQTQHDQYIANAVATGLSAIIVQSGVPIAFGVLTCPSLEHARARAGGEVGNKGQEAMAAAIAAAVTVNSVRAAQESGI